MPFLEVTEPHSPSALKQKLLAATRRLLSAYGGFILVVLLLAPLHFLPAEDVVILHAYSRNLAHTGAITYYPGGPHAEGATDFGWMLLLAGALRLGIAEVWFTAVVNAVSLMGISILLLRLAGQRLTVVNILFLCGAAGLLPQILAAVSGFPVLPFAWLLLWLLRAVLAEQIAATGLLALALCLFRPDGVVFAVPLLFWLLTRVSRRKEAVVALCATFLLPGMAYFCWRAWYFHALLPLPFLVKSDVHRTLGIVPHSVAQSLKYLLVLGSVLAYVPCRERVRLRGLLVGLAVVPTLFFWTERLDQNVGDRFFFYLPLCTAILLAWRHLPLRDRNKLYLALPCIYLVLLCGPFLREIRTFRNYQFRDVEAIARGLGQLPGRGVLLSSEAGFLAYGSGWIAYDPWGLNTAAFTRHLIQPGDVSALAPDLIVLHPGIGLSCTLPSATMQASTIRTWDNMTRNVLLGIHAMHAYSLWQLSYGSEAYRRTHGWGYGEGDPECFFVRQDTPFTDGIRNLLTAHHAVAVSRSNAPAQ